MSYSELLKDPRWQRKRLEILQRDNFTCRCCGDKETTLHVHHVKYNGLPWEVDSNLLITFCEDCHFLHETYKDFIIRKVLKKHTTKGNMLFVLICDGFTLFCVVDGSDILDNLGVDDDFFNMIISEKDIIESNG